MDAVEEQLVVDIARRASRAVGGGDGWVSTVAVRDVESSSVAIRVVVDDKSAGVETICGSSLSFTLRISQASPRRAPDGQRRLPRGRAAAHDQVTLRRRPVASSPFSMAAAHLRASSPRRVADDDAVARVGLKQQSVVGPPPAAERRPCALGSSWP